MGKRTLRRGKSSDIDREAQRIFADLVPMHWLPEPFTFFDFGKDYHIELSEKESGGRILGAKFYAQLKGTASLSPLICRPTIPFRMELKHLNYFHHHQRGAVFLVVIDVRSKNGVWLFLQEYLENCVEWQNCKSRATLHIPLSNSLSDFDRFEREAWRAIQFMEDRAGTISGRIATDRRRLERIDPRFEYIHQISGQSTNISILPKEKVTINLKFTGTSGIDKLRTFVEDGTQLNFTKDELFIEGSDLFEHATSVVLSDSKPIRVRVKFSCANDIHGERKQFTVDVDATLRGGTKKQTINSQLPHLPFGVSFGVECLPDQNETSQLRITNSEFWVSVEKWSGRKLLSLPYFAVTLDWFRNLSHSPLVFVSLWWEGQEVLETHSAIESDDATAFVHFLELVEKMRYVSELHGIDPVFDHRQFEDREFWFHVEQVYQLCRFGKCVLQAEQTDGTYLVPVDEALLWQEGQCVRRKLLDVTADWLNCKLQLGDIYTQLKPVIFESVTEKDGKMEMRWKSGCDAKMLYFIPEAFDTK